MKTKDLSGAALEWAVAKCEGKPYPSADTNDNLYQPSTDWTQGGPIIESEGVAIRPSEDDGLWVAECAWHRAVGETPLIAAMRCYVVSKLGGEIEVPEELQ